MTKATSTIVAVAFFSSVWKEVIAVDWLVFCYLCCEESKTLQSDY